jgi:hypothetical protein
MKRNRQIQYLSLSWQDYRNILISEISEILDESFDRLNKMQHKKIPLCGNSSNTRQILQLEYCQEIKYT